MSHRKRFPVILFATLLTLLLVTQGYWIARNQTILGSDAGAHLVRSIEVLDALRNIDRDAIKSVWDVSEHRPPISYVLTVPFYALLGRTYDAALWSNTVWLALTSVVVFLFARSAGDDWDALLASSLTATTPLLFQLARLYYQETLVTLLLWSAMLFLLRSDGFRSRPYAFVFGITVGLSLLVKWTTPALLAGAVGWVAWRYRDGWEVHLALRAREATAALTASASLTALTGWALAPTFAGNEFWTSLIAWALLYFLLTYLLLSPVVTRSSNFLMAILSATAVGSWWYFPNFQFAELFGALVFGDAGRPEELGGFTLLSYLRPETWLYYLRAFAFEQGGLIWAAALVLSIGLVMKGQARARHDGTTGRHPDAIGMSAATLLAAWLIFTLSPFRDHARSMAPLLPAVAIVTVHGLRRAMKRGSVLAGVGTYALTGLIVWQVFQYFALTVPHVEPLASPLQSNRLLVDGDYQYFPDSGPSASEFHVAPAVLEHLRPYQGEDGPVTLAMLINETQLHQNTLRAYFGYADPGVVRVLPLTRDSRFPYEELFGARFVLYKSGESNDLSEEALSALRRVTTESDGLFAALFETVWTQPLRGGDEIVLARRRQPLVPDLVRPPYGPLVGTLSALYTTDDILVIDNPSEADPLEGVHPNGASGSERLFALLWQPHPETEPTLNSTWIRGEEWWFDDVHMITYVAPSTPTDVVRDVGQVGDERLAALEYSRSEVAPGGGLVVTLNWLLRGGSASGAELRTVLELYDAEGNLLARRDLPPDPAFDSSAEVTQRTALVLPRTIGPMPACLIVARYDPGTGERLLTPTGDDKLQVCL